MANRNQVTSKRLAHCLLVTKIRPNALLDLVDVFNETALQNDQTAFHLIRLRFKMETESVYCRTSQKVIRLIFEHLAKIN